MHFVETTKNVCRQIKYFQSIIFPILITAVQFRVEQKLSQILILYLTCKRGSSWIILIIDLRVIIYNYSLLLRSIRVFMNLENDIFRVT